MHFSVNIKKIAEALFIMVMAFLALRIDSFSILSHFGMYNWASLFVALLFGGLIVVRNKRHIRVELVLVVLFWVVLIVSSGLSNVSDSKHALYTCAPALAISLMTEFYLKKNADLYLYALAVLLTLLVLIDIYTEVFYPQGLYQTSMYSINWFLGYKTARVRVATMPLIAIVAALDIKRKDQLSLLFYVLSFFCMISTVLSQNVGGAVAVGAYFLFLVLVCCPIESIRRMIYKKLNINVLLIVVCLLGVMINMFKQLFFLDTFITSGLGKSSTLGNRFIIWDVAMALFRSSPIIGKGCIYSQYMANAVGFVEATQPHSLMLGILSYTGCIGMVIFLTLLLKTMKLKGKQCNTIGFVWGGFVIFQLVLGITSMMLFSHFLFAAMLILSKENTSVKLIEIGRE